MGKIKNTGIILLQENLPDWARVADGKGYKTTIKAMIPDGDRINREFIIEVRKVTLPGKTVDITEAISEMQESSDKEILTYPETDGVRKIAAVILNQAWIISGCTSESKTPIVIVYIRSFQTAWYSFITVAEENSTDPDTRVFGDIFDIFKGFGKTSKKSG